MSAFVLSHLPPPSLSNNKNYHLLCAYEPLGTGLKTLLNPNISQLPSWEMGTVIIYLQG